MMGNLSLRERAILLGCVVLVLYFLAAIMWFMKFDRDWTKSMKTYESAVKTYRKEAALIAKRDSLQAQYDEEQEKIPTLSDDEPADTRWMAALTTLAEKNNVAISGKKPGREEQEDVLNKLEVELEWTASLQSLVKFMYELESAQDAMFDIRSIGIAASGRNTGYLKGKMTVCCAYLREDEEKGKAK